MNGITLEPKLPPGRANRKALAFTTEIQRLRDAGYSFEAIRIALAEVGLTVSRTTLKREAARCSTRKTPGAAASSAGNTAPSTALPPALASASASTPAPAAAASTLVRIGQCARTTFEGDRRTGKEIAAEFAAQLITNPLIRERLRNEARRD